MGDGQTLNGQGTAIIATSAALSFLAIITVVLRFVARICKSSRFYLDDYLIVVGLVFALGVTINNIVAVSIAGIGEHEHFRTSGPEKGFPLAKELAPEGKVMFALQILHTCAMPIIKSSILAFYIRLFPTRRFKIAVYIVFAYVFSWFVSTLFVTLFQCRPISANWGTEPEQLNGCMPKANVFYETAAFMNMVGDILVLGLPFPVVLGLQMTRKNMVAILAIFLTGSVVVVAGIGRTVAYFKDNYNKNYDFSYWYYPLVIWSSVEPTLGVISACLPTLRPLFSVFSLESVISSVHSLLSLHSMRRNRSGRERIPDDLRHLRAEAANGTSTTQCHGQNAIRRLPDPNGSSDENQHVVMELEDLKNRQKAMPAKGILVQEDLDQNVVHTTDQAV